MSKIDIFILIVIGIFTLIGYYRGLLGVAFSLVQYIAVIYFGVLLTPLFSQFLISTFKLDIVILDFAYNNPGIFDNVISLLEEDVLNGIVYRVINVISFILLFILLKILFSIIFSILNKITKLPIINEVNKLGGILLGLIEGIVIVYLMMLLVNWLPIVAVNPIKEELPHSKIGNVINSFVPNITDEIFTYVGNISNDVEKNVEISVKG